MLGLFWFDCTVWLICLITGGKFLSLLTPGVWLPLRSAGFWVWWVLGFGFGGDDA